MPSERSRSIRSLGSQDSSRAQGNGGTLNSGGKGRVRLRINGSESSFFHPKRKEGMSGAEGKRKRRTKIPGGGEQGRRNSRRHRRVNLPAEGGRRVQDGLKSPINCIGRRH